MENDIPHEQIRADEDRSWSLLLTKLLSEGRHSDLKELSMTLSALDDYRTIPPLTSILLDSSNREEVRQAASDALCGCTTTETSEDRKAWWASGEPVLMRHAVRMAEMEESGLITEIASNPEHPFYLDAVKHLCFWEEPVYQHLIINALSDNRPEVRKEAAECLLWEQPVAAERKLIELAWCRNGHFEVADAALETLCYCASQELLVALHVMLRTGLGELKDSYENAYTWVSKEFFPYLEVETWESRASRQYFDKWVAPVRGLLQSKELLEPKPTQATSTAPKKATTIKRSIPNVDEIIADLGACRKNNYRRSY